MFSKKNIVLYFSWFPPERNDKIFDFENFLVIDWVITPALIHTGLVKQIKAGIITFSHFQKYF